MEETGTMDYGTADSGITDYSTPTDDTGTTYRYTDPISSFFGGIFFIIIFALIIIFMVILMVYRGFSWFGDRVTGTKEGFEVAKPGPQPCPEHDERCADFPAI